MEIILPKIKSINQKGDYGEFVISPLQPGYGITLGNSLRRILLSSLAGASVKTVAIEGVDHEFSTLNGIKEDVIEIILAIKNLRLRLDSDDQVELVIKKKGPGKVTAKDIQAPGNATVVNDNLHIATLQKSGELFARLVADRGIGYIAAEEREDEDRSIGEIAIDANYAPIDRVSYAVEPTRVGGSIDYDKLTVKVKTDGTVDPADAIQQASKILVKHFDLISELSEKEEKIEVDVEAKTKKEKATTKPKKKDKKSKPKIDRTTPVEKAGLSGRTLSVLQANNIRTLGGLARYNEETLTEMEGLGPKSVDEISKLIEKAGI